ncbi:MAG TPA: YihY/virulence factor BrkB family protein [Chloroflexia bacterium]|nr:YihY/virulence factor BrkB family protein [Chloroflexia bacterium]
MTRKEFITVLKATWREFGRDDVGNMAAALTYYSFFSLFPLLLLSITVVSFWLGRDQAYSLIFDNIVRVLPGSGELLSEAVDAALSTRQNAGILALVGLLTLVWSASGAFDALDKAINRAWKTEKMPGFFISKLFSFGMMIVMAGIVLASLFTTAILTTSRTLASNVFGQVPGENVFWQVVNFAVTLAIVFLVFVLMYRLLPRYDVGFRDVWLGALMAASAWAIVKEGFAYYLGSSFANYNAVYGTLGAVVALLTWIYLSSLIILIGAEFSAETARVRRLRLATMGKDPDSGEQKAKPSPWFSEGKQET